MIFCGVALLIIIALIFFKPWQYINPEGIKTYLESFGPWTPIVYSLLYLVAVFIPHAGTAMTVVGGLLFNPLFGTLLVITVSSLGSVFPFLLARKYGRTYVKKKLKDHKYEKYLHKTDDNSFIFALYMRLIPGIPYELQSYIIGLVDISVPKFILATFVGLLPGTFVLVYLGNTITDLSLTNIIILVASSLVAILLPIILKKYTKAKKILHLNDNKEEKEN